MQVINKLATGLSEFFSVLHVLAGLNVAYGLVSLGSSCSVELEYLARATDVAIIYLLLLNADSLH